MMIARGVSLKTDVPDLFVIGLTPATLERLFDEQSIVIERPAGIPFTLNIVFAMNDAALVQYMKDHGASNVLVQDVDAATQES